MIIKEKYIFIYICILSWSIEPCFSRIDKKKEVARQIKFSKREASLLLSEWERSLFTKAEWMVLTKSIDRSINLSWTSRIDVESFSSWKSILSKKPLNDSREERMLHSKEKKSPSVRASTRVDSFSKQSSKNDNSNSVLCILISIGALFSISSALWWGGWSRKELSSVIFSFTEIKSSLGLLFSKSKSNESTVKSIWAFKI